MKDLRSISPKLFEQDQNPVGDDASRSSFFNHELAPLATHKGKPVKLHIASSVRVPNYKNKAVRQPIYIPSKLKENMRALLGADADDDYKVSTTMIALADFAAQYLLSQDKTLYVTQPKTPKA